MPIFAACRKAAIVALRVEPLLLGEGERVDADELAVGRLGDDAVR